MYPGAIELTVMPFGPSSALSQRGQRQPGQPQRRHQRQLPGRSPLLVVEVLEAAGRWSAGVVDDDVEPSERLQRAIDQPGEVGRIGGVTGHRKAAGAGAERLDLGHGLVQQLLPAGEEGDVASLAGERDRHRPAHPRRRPAHDRHTPAQTKIHPCLIS